MPLVNTCYDGPFSDCINSVGPTLAALEPISDSDLVIQPETFRQLCYFSTDPEYSDPLRHTVKELLSRAQRDGNLVVEGVDRSRICEDADNFLGKLTKLRVPDANLEDVAPFGFSPVFRNSPYPITRFGT
jgi:hypothetical protein